MLGKDMHIPQDTNRPAVQEQIQWYMQHTDYLERTASRASPYVYYILQQIKKRDMPAEIALLPIIESGYNPFAHSGAGAAGLWQIMPSTAIGFSLRENWWYDGRRDFYKATPAALDYLQYLSTLFHGDWLLAIAAYNSGEGTVNAAIRYNHRHNLPTDFWDLKLPEQTRAYIPSLLALATIISDPKQYPINWPPTKVEPAVAPVHVGGQIDLDKAAHLAGISVNQMYILNPGYTRRATDPNGDHLLIIPADKVDDFNDNLAKLPEAERVTWDAYEVKLHDTIEKIAKKFRTTPKVIQQINNLTTRALHPGTTLRLPKSQVIVSTDVVDAVNQYAMNNRTVAPPEPETYIVRKYDTIKSIARQHNADIRNILFWNQLKPGDKLTPGTTIIIRPHSKARYQYLDNPHPSLPVKKVEPVDGTLPLSKAHPAQAASSLLLLNDNTAPQTNASSLLRPSSYEVQPGDTVITIAHKFGVAPKTIKSYNNLESNLLHVGQILKIPPQ
jgi:membrane-bound lytic murein transglycosylase D